jgi:hypothetical protein
MKFTKIFISLFVACFLLSVNDGHSCIPQPTLIQVNGAGYVPPDKEIWATPNSVRIGDERFETRGIQGKKRWCKVTTSRRKKTYDCELAGKVLKIDTGYMTTMEFGSKLRPTDHHAELEFDENGTSFTLRKNY